MQRRGWDACPSKSLPALAIEESVLNRIRESRPGTMEPSAWVQMDRLRQVATIQEIIERVSYEGVARRVSIRFQTMATSALGGKV